jgi:hypothetical protein
VRRSVNLLLALALVAGPLGTLGYVAWRELGERIRIDKAFSSDADAIFRSPASFVADNPDGDVSVVAFFDHNCPDCRADTPVLAKLVATDAKVRLVPK